jgi:hypothetical protein
MHKQLPVKSTVHFSLGLNSKTMQKTPKNKGTQKKNLKNQKAQKAQKSRKSPKYHGHTQSQR